MSEPENPVLRILHHGRQYIVRFVVCTPEPWAVVCFEYWKPAPTLDGEFSGEGFFRHRGLNAIGIMAATNDWFQDDEILQVLAAIRAATHGWHLVGYGGSMGGFAAINFAADLNLASIIAIIPQFSIDAARAPYETRWRGEAAAITFRHDKIDQVPPQRHGWIVYDPWCVDGKHAADIQARHQLTQVRVPFGGHNQMGMLQQADVYTDMFSDMLADRFDLPAFRRRWRVRRRQSAYFWLGLAQYFLRRGAPAASLRCIAQARPLPHPEPGWLDLTQADALADMGQLPAARALAEAWQSDPGFGGEASLRLEKWALPAPRARLLPRLRARLARTIFKSS